MEDDTLLTAAGTYWLTYCFGYPPIYNQCGASTPVIGVDKNSLSWTVSSACPTLHAGVIINNLNPLLLLSKNAVRTYCHTHAATNTSLHV